MTYDDLLEVKASFFPIVIRIDYVLFPFPLVVKWIFLLLLCVWIFNVNVSHRWAIRNPSNPRCEKLECVDPAIQESRITLKVLVAYIMRLTFKVTMLLKVLNMDM